MMKYGVIGLGNMASAIVLGMHKNGTFASNAICGFDCDAMKMQMLSEKIGLLPCESAKDVAKTADVILLAVKPQVMQSVLEQIKDVLTAEKLVVTIAAGKPLAFYAQILGENQPVVRVMPNINARVQAAVSAICPNQAATQEQTEIAKAMFASVGSVSSFFSSEMGVATILGVSFTFSALSLSAEYTLLATSFLWMRVRCRRSFLSSSAATFFCAPAMACSSRIR